MSYEEIIAKVSKDTGISEEIVNKAYKGFWLFVKDTIQNLPLKEDLSEDEFMSLRTGFNIPSLGKLGCTYQKYKKVKDKFKYIKKIKDKSEKIN